MGSEHTRREGIWRAIVGACASMAAGCRRGHSTCSQCPLLLLERAYGVYWLNL